MEVFRDLPSSSALAAFCKEDASEREFSNELRTILEVSAMTGLYWHNWDELRALLLFRLKQVLQDYYKSHMDVAIGPPRPLVTGESYQELEDRLSTGLKSFTDGAPFTLQRFCEVLLDPRDRYPNLDKVALAFEKLLLVTSTISPSSGPYPGIASVPAPIPAPALAQDADPKPVESSPRRENVDSNSNTTSEPNDGPVETVATASVAADEEMVDIVVSTESKEEAMDVDGPQPSGTIAADEGSQENAPEVSVAKEEWQLVDAADISAAAAPTTESNQQSAPMVDRNESEGGVAASRL